MKNYLLLAAVVLTTASCAEQSTENAQNQEEKVAGIPIPTQVYDNLADEEDFEQRRDAYFDLIHGNYPDWRELNAETHKMQAELRAYKLQSRDVETFADGALDAEWRERGSKDVPGNIRISDYHTATEDVYVVSDGGILWKGNLNGETWTPLTDGAPVGRRILKLVDLPDGTLRIITANNHVPRYSDDGGETWTESAGFGGIYGNGNALFQLNNAENTLVYLYRTTSGAARNKIAYSTDNGTSFTFVMDLDENSQNKVSMHAAHNSNAAYILDGPDVLRKFEGTTVTTLSDDLSMGGTSRCMIRVNETDDGLTFYALMDNNMLYTSTDDGASFSYVSNLPTSTWDVGISVAIDDPNTLYYGEVNLYRSTNGGETFELVSEWWEYYSDVENKIHADIMSITPFEKTDGTEFTLVPNHGGISISYDNLATTPNLAMQDLNTGQFYDVLTHPNNSALIFGGTQDQGFQRTLTGDTPEPSNFEQVISGDYGEMQFTDNGKTIWIQYPGAWIPVYDNAETDEGYATTVDIEGSNMPNVNWIVPTGAAPHDEDKFIYIGGGNLSGGAGSHLIKATYEAGEISTTQFDFDFYAASGGAAISAIETTPFQDNFIYVVTENGRFFYSENEGETFEMTPSYAGPSGGWIYTADIYASRLTPGLVFVGGSNYGSSSVYMSTDSARSFTALSSGIPNTMVHEMTMDPSEQFLFAATDAGPYVYDMNAEEWFNIAGISAPIQEYISVEFIPSEYLVRFATWGRGIWDFDIQSVASVESGIQKDITISIYPNPSTSSKVITIIASNKGIAQLVDLNGRVVAVNQLTNGSNIVDFSMATAGTYLLHIVSEDGTEITEKVILR